MCMEDNALRGYDFTIVSDIAKNEVVNAEDFSYTKIGDSVTAQAENDGTTYVMDKDGNAVKDGKKRQSQDEIEKEFEALQQELRQMANPDGAGDGDTNQNANPDNDFNFVVPDAWKNSKMQTGADANVKIDDAKLSEEADSQNNAGGEDKDTKDAEKPVTEKFKDYSEFISAEKAEISIKINAIKASHPKDYYKYVEDLRSTDYYKICLEKWRKYYADKRAEFEKLGDAQKTLDIEASAKNDAMEENSALLNNTQKVYKVDTPEHQTKQDTAATYSNFDVTNLLNDNGVEYKLNQNQVNTKNLQPTTQKPSAKLISGQSKDFHIMDVDQNLRKTVKLILLNNLYDAIDGNRDYYVEQKADIDAMKRNHAGIKQNVYSRAEISQDLVKSMSKMFDTTLSNVLKPYKPMIEVMQQNLERNKDNMNVELACDMYLDKFYHLDTQTGKETGIIPELADFVTLKIQEKLLMNGQADFNLNKESAEIMINKLALGANLASNISMINEIDANEQQQVVKDLLSIFNSIMYGSKTGNMLVTDKMVDSIKQTLATAKQNGSFSFTDDQYKSLDAMCNLASRCLNYPNGFSKQGKTAEQLVDIVAIQNKVNGAQKTLTSYLDDENKVNVKSNKNFDKRNLKRDKQTGVYQEKENGIQSIFDYMISDVVKEVAKARASQNFNSFALTNKQVSEKITEAKELLDFNKNSENEVVSEILVNLLLSMHDIREKSTDDVQKANAQNCVEKLQHAVDLLDKSNDENAVNVYQSVINDAISTSIKVASNKNSKSRTKTGLEKSIFEEKVGA